MKKILIVGAGAIGGSLAAYLGQTNSSITIYERQKGIADEINRAGVTLTGDKAPLHAAVMAVSDLRMLRREYDVCFLATRAYQLQEAAQSVLPYLKDSALMVSMNNGVCIDELLSVAGELSACWCSINFGAGIQSPANYFLKIRGGIVLGMKGGYCPPQLLELQRLIDPVLKCEITDNIIGTLYSKMLINACITSTAIMTGQTLGDILASPEGRQIFDRIMMEGVRMAKAEGIRIVPYRGKLNYYFLCANNPVSKLFRRIYYHFLGKKYRERTSATLEAMRRGVRSETDYYNGYICRLGNSHHIACPVNMEICRTVREIEQDLNLISPYNLKLILQKN